jgi:hypothetical protein
MTEVRGHEVRGRKSCEVICPEKGLSENLLLSPQFYFASS